jgi:alkaline phosphatase D
MDYSRRKFLQAAGLVMASSALPIWAKAQTLDMIPPILLPEILNPKAMPILQGATDLTSTSILVLHPNQRELTVKISAPQRRPLDFQIVDSWELPYSLYSITEFFVSGLLPGEENLLEIFDASGDLLDSRTFSGLDISKSQCRFAVASCMRDGSGNKMISMWEALDREQCDFVLLVGDTCYADIDNRDKDEQGYARRYAETRSQIAWFRKKRLTPTLATWDDHDFGGNNLDRTFPLAPFTRELFQKFWGKKANLVWQRAHGVGSVLRAFGQRFFLMDDRSFRDGDGIRLGRHWGMNQTDWLISELEKNEEPAWILNGSQVFGAYLAKESMEGNHPEDLKEILKRLSIVKAPVVFVSGDVHFSEIMNIEESLLGYPSVEFTSSSMHSLTFPGHQNRAKNPRRIVSEWRHNFMVFDVNVAKGWQIYARSILENNRVSFSHSVEISRG